MLRFLTFIHLENVDDKSVIKMLIKYKSGGNYFLVYKYIKEHCKNGVCEITQSQIGESLNRSRQAVSEALKVLQDNGLIDHSYKKIILKRESHEE